MATQYGAKNLHIFGSVARGEANQNSDVDLLVEIQSSLLTRIALIQDLETLLNTKVDVVTEPGLHEHLSWRVAKNLYEGNWNKGNGGQKRSVAHPTWLSGRIY